MDLYSDLGAVTKQIFKKVFEYKQGGSSLYIPFEALHFIYKKTEAIYPKNHSRSSYYLCL
jgi:hypothetical protein